MNEHTTVTRHIPLVRPDLPEYEVLEPLFRGIIQSGKLTNFGRYATEFEQLCATRMGTHALTMSSGTTALILTLQALGIGAGSRVALPSYTFTATAQALLYLSAEPVFVDVDESLTLDPVALDSVLRRDESIGAVIGVHVHGNPCDVHRLQEVVGAASTRRQRRLPLIYDAAHAFGSAVHGVPVGRFGDAEVFSLSITKALVCGEGGLVTTSSDQLRTALLAKRNYGVAAKYNAELPGLNGKIGELHAAIGCKNIELLDHVLATRAVKASRYRAMLEQQCEVSFPIVRADVTHTWKDFTVLLRPEDASRRSVVAQYLHHQGIETRAYFSPAVHQQTHFRNDKHAPLPITEDASARVFTLPFYTSISDDDMSFIASALAKALRRATAD